MVAILQGNTAPPDSVASHAADRSVVATAIPHPRVGTPRRLAATAVVMGATMVAPAAITVAQAVPMAVAAEDSTAADIANSQAFQPDNAAFWGGVDFCSGRLGVPSRPLETNSTRRETFKIIDNLLTT